MRATKQRVVVCRDNAGKLYAETMQANKQRAKVDPLMQKAYVQATKQLADDAFGAVLAHPG